MCDVIGTHLLCISTLGIRLVPAQRVADGAASGRHVGSRPAHAPWQTHWSTE